MKKCGACGEVFNADFAFCPIDGNPFTSTNRDSNSFRLTLIEETLLTRRLAIELWFFIERLRAVWPDFKQNPVAFSKAKSIEIAKFLTAALRRPYARTGLAAALTGVMLLILGVSFVERRTPPTGDVDLGDELFEVAILNSANEIEPNAGADGAVPEKGRVGINKGKGEGSNPEPSRAQGGGSGGNREKLPPSQGRPPVASPVSAPITRTYARLPSLPAAGIDLDPALWRNLDFASYGDPRSKYTTPSNGPGEDGGIGTNKGTGIGEGEGPGLFDGKNGNTGGGNNRRGSGGESGGPGCATPPCSSRDQVYHSPDVTARARVLFKPEPQYTEIARKNGTTGTVILRVVFTSTGEVTNIQVVQKLGDGLTEKAIAAAKLIRFEPAKRGNQPVSMYMQLQYNFNLY